MARRSVAIEVRVTPDEMKVIREAAKAQALPVSTLMRSTTVRVAREILQGPASP